MTFVSYAQNFEDVLLWRALHGVGEGFYIDAGASLPDTDSVTRAFYERGWRGINVEPVAASFERLCAERPRDVNLQLALSDAAGSARFFSMEGQYTGLSTLNPAVLPDYGAQGITAQETEVRTETLAAICRAHVQGEIHFLKVDVEGAERVVLLGADFAVFRPWIVLVEATAPMTPVANHEGWEPILLESGYRFAWFDGLNRFYLAGERWEALSPHFRVPPNVFDGFRLAASPDPAVLEALARLEEQAGRLAVLVAEQREAIAALRAGLGNVRK